MTTSPHLDREVGEKFQLERESAYRANLITGDMHTAGLKIFGVYRIEKQRWLRIILDEMIDSYRGWRKSSESQL